MSVIPMVVEHHVEEATLLWLRRDRAVCEPHFTLDDLAALDGQLEAHLDGALIAGEEGWVVAEGELGWEEPGEVFAAAVLALGQERDEHVKRVFYLASESYEFSRAFVSALGWLSYAQVEEVIAKLLEVGPAAYRRIGIAAATIHRRDPGPALVEALDDPDPLLAARALRAVGELGQVDLVPRVRQHLQSDDAGRRVAAAWSAGILARDARAIEVLKQTVEEQVGQQDTTDGQSVLRRQQFLALELASRLIEPEEAKAWLKQLARKPQTARPTVIAAGVTGLPEFVPWLIEQMKVPHLARVASEAFGMITGVDIAYHDLEGQWPDGFHAGPTEDPEDENVEMDLDENLPWPNPEAIAQWWQAKRDRFQPGVRYLLGKPITEDWLKHVLRHGYQRQRFAAALELAIRLPGQPLFELRAPGYRQQKVLGLKGCRDQSHGDQADLSSH